MEGRMRRAFKALAIAFVAGAALASPALAQPRADASTTPQVPRCARNLGTVSIQNGDSAGWTGYRLQPPAALLRVVVQQSGCFTVVERGAGLDAAMRERELSGGGQLQAGSNVGGGQVRAADYVLLADVVAQDNNSSGGGFGAALGGVVGGRLGGVIGGVGARSQTAQTTLTLANVRTTESFSAEGNARNRNWTWGGIGFLGGGGAGLGGYTDTEIGRVITIAFVDAYTNLVQQAGGGPAIAGAPRESFRVTVASTPLRSGPGTGETLRNLRSGAVVYPTGERSGMWWRAQDENGNEGWVNNDDLAPFQ
jgi:curli biogenesis system outer membrane secretion channel CsgG